MIAALRLHFIPFFALLGLLALTAFCAVLPLGAFNLPLSLAFSAAKTLLVALFFMELKSSSMLVRLAAFVGLMWLSFLLLLALSDYLTRFPGIDFH